MDMDKKNDVHRMERFDYCGYEKRKHERKLMQLAKRK